MRQLRATVRALLHAITVTEADTKIAACERETMLDALYRELADARSRLKQMTRAA